MISCQATHVAGTSSQGDLDFYHSFIAQHYRQRCNRTSEQREASPIIQLKKLHGWIKDVLIRMCAQRGGTVLDMACGKGGDLGKWYKAEVRLYVGVDIVETSLQQARKRYQELMAVAAANVQLSRRSSYAGGGAAAAARSNTRSFTARFVCSDCFTDSLRAQVRALAGNGFDVCSCQFALHYSWSTAARARATLANVAALLKPGGYFMGTIPDCDVIVGKLRRAAPSMSAGGEFGNKLYRVKFDRQQHTRALRYASNEEPYGIQYEFHLEDAVDHCPEWLVPFHELKTLAQQHGLELVLKQNFHDFVRENMQAGSVGELMRKLGGAAGGTISGEEWECVSLYLVFVFQKRA